MNLQRIHLEDYLIYQRGSDQSIRWYGDFRQLGSGKKALSPRLIYHDGPSRGVTDEDDALRIADVYAGQLRSAIEGQGDLDEPVYTLGEYIEQYLDGLYTFEGQRGRLRSDRYLRDTKSQLLYAADFLGASRLLASIHPTQIRAYLKHLTTRRLASGSRPTPRTVKIYVQRLDEMLRSAVDLALISRNPVDGIRRQIPAGRPTKKQEALDPESVRRFIRAAKEYDDRTGHYMHPLVTLVAHSGLRKSEATGLRVCDVQFAELDQGPEMRGGTPHAEGRIIVEAHEGRRSLKTARSKRIVPLWPDAAAVLAPFVQGRAPNTPLFPSPKDPSKPIGDPKRAWKSVREAAGLPNWVTFHTLRHTYGSVRIQTTEGGVPVSEFTVIREMGWTSIKMFEEVYGHVLRDRSIRREVVSY